MKGNKRFKPFKKATQKIQEKKSKLANKNKWEKKD